ncbi:DNA repair protein RecN [Xylanibacter brevis]|uniref:DNA repair protein RecN n=1 Tax=Xylanibacter brevis TaxID=83231 RepID=UPI00047F3412|nr:DNA repair protein RecN [Xylanibacter brevis]
MLKQLYIKNYALIDQLDINFESGFSVITGETGAGKSIVLGAIGLLLGQRADSKSIKQGAEKCVIEAHFDLSRYQMEAFFEQNDIEYDAEDTIVRRELTAAGKSRAFINDEPVALSLMKELGDQLVDVHSQHQNLLLGKQDFQLEVIDIVADDEALMAHYRESYEKMHATERELEDMRQEIARNQQQVDFLRFQFNELDAAGLVDGEQDELEQKQERMTHAEDIKQALYETDTLLMNEATGAVGALRKAASSLHSIEHVLPELKDLAERLNSCYIEAKDVASDVSGQLEDVDFDPAELDHVNARLDKIYDLEKKYRVETIGELISQRDKLKCQLDAIDNSDDALTSLERRLQKERNDATEIAEKLTKKRLEASHLIYKKMIASLQLLGMPRVTFQIQIDKADLGPKGQDRVAFLFSANSSTPLLPIAQVASGGEIARVMLSLKAMISGVVKLPTIIFDEVDTGVSGKIAEQMAQIMSDMGQNGRQVISITHLPQIAAKGCAHYKVYKEETDSGTKSHMQRLTNDERINEIAQMLSGSDISSAAIENARQLLKIS